MAVKDNRILINSADSTTGWFATSSAALDTEIFYEGTGSIAEQITKTRRAIMYDTGGTGLQNSNFYFLVNCGVVGLLLTQAAGGFTIRFSSETSAGNPDTNFFEVYVAGSNFWPQSFAGGWTVFVVDIEKAAASPDNTAGTPPATTAVRSIGYSAITTGSTRNTDNTWIDAIYRLPFGDPGFIVEGTNTGNPYTFADILSYSNTNRSAAFRQGPGGSYVSSAPIQIGNTTTGQTHSFVDTNVTLLWDSQQFANTSLYNIDIVGTSGSSTTVTAGNKTGTGDEATGGQGWTIQAASTANRWSLLANNETANVGIYGCSFSHGDLFRLESANTETISTFFIDCNQLVHSTTASSGAVTYLKNTVINANTADGTAFVKTIDPTNIKSSTFEFSDGHAIEITTLGTTSTFTLSNDTFLNYGANTTNDAAIYNNSGQSVTLNISGGTTPTVRNGVGASTTVEATVSVTITNMKDFTEVRVLSGGSEIAGAEDVGSPTNPSGDGLFNGTVGGTTNARTFTFSTQAATALTIRTVNINFVDGGYWLADDIEYTTTSDTNQLVQVAQRPDRVYSNP